MWLLGLITHMTMLCQFRSLPHGHMVLSIEASVLTTCELVSLGFEKVDFSSLYDPVSEVICGHSFHI